ncbi:MAG TPA: pseudouridine synthase [Planctomycetota bacterium]|nr:pseudouridine synthase [Planctomycetota bacterium]
MGPESNKKTLDRALSRAGICSRNVAREWIAAGRVRVNGTTARTAEQWVDMSRDQLEVDGRRLSTKSRVYLALNKPKGVLTSHGDPQARRTVYDLLGELDVWVVPVGRLDRDTSGLLLLTNDTDWAEAVTSPERHVPKTYRAEVAPRLDEEGIERLRRGVELEDGPTRPAVVTRLRDVGATSILEITISEGRNRQVRRMVRAVGGRVRSLKRISIGALALGELASGKSRPLTRAEVELFHRPAPRGPGVR